jgi:hypothetical protein
VNGSGQRARRSRRVLVLATAAVCLGVVVASPLFGTADPTGAFRPPVTTPRLAGACSPLPDGVTLDFAHQVRSDHRERDGDAQRRAIRLQFDLIDVDEAESEVETELVAAGFREQAAVDGRFRFFRRDDYGVVGLAVEPLWEDRPDAIVRGVMRLKLPVTTYQDEPSRCRGGVG